MSIRTVIIGSVAKQAAQLIIYDTPELVSSGAFASGLLTTTINPPPYYIDGDLIIIAISSLNQPVTDLTSSGWTRFSNMPVGTGTASALNSTSIDLYYRFASGALSSATGTVSDGLVTGRMFAFRKVNSGNPLQNTANAVVSTAGTTHGFPAVTTTTNNALIAMFSGIGRDITENVNYTSATNANLSGLSIIVSQTIDTGNGGGHGLVVGVKNTPGDIGTTNITTQTSKGALQTAALNPTIGYSLDRVVGSNGFATQSVIGSTANAAIVLRANGKTTLVAGSSNIQDWYGIEKASIGSSYYVRASNVTVTGSGTFSGDTSAWNLISTDRTWSLQDPSTAGSSRWVFKLEFSPNSNGVPVIATSLIDLFSEGSPTPTVNPSVSPEVNPAVEPVVNPVNP